MGVSADFLNEDSSMRMDALILVYGSHWPTDFIHRVWGSFRQELVKYMVLTLSTDTRSLIKCLFISFVIQ
jgi:hypothetical protein